MSFKDKFNSLRDILFGTAFDPIQERGFKPVFVVVSQNSYADTKLGTKLLVDTLPRDLKAKIGSWYVRDDYAYIQTEGDWDFTQSTAATTLSSSAEEVVKETIGSIKDSVIQSVTGTPASPEDRPLEGCMIDFSLHNQPYPNAHIIFQNPTVSNPKGDQLFGTDLLKVGFPIWIYVGYIDQAGNIVKHPFDTQPLLHIPLVFAGLIGAIGQEITDSAGDRMQLVAVGYMWYMSHFELYTEGIDQVTVEMSTTIDVAIQRVFDEFYKNGGSSIPDIIKQAMRLNVKAAVGVEINPLVPAGTVVENTFKPSVRYIYGASSTMVPIKSNFMINKIPVVVLGSRGDDFCQMIQTIEYHYGVDIEWGVHGFLNIHGRSDPFTRMLDKEGKANEKHNTRVHDAIIGGNVKNLDVSVDTEGVACGLRLTIHSPDTSHASETFIFYVSDVERILQDWEEEAKVTKEPVVDELNPTMIAGKKALVTDNDMFKLFGDKTFSLDVIQYTTQSPSLGSDYLVLSEVAGADEKTSPVEIEYRNKRIIVPWPKEALQALFRRLKFWGMRGSAMLIGNSNIREGDLLRITDIRPKGSILNIDMSAYQNTIASIADKVSEIQNDEKVSELYQGKRLGIMAFDNVYFIWKIKHYVGPPGYWTKVWFTKQRDSLMSVSKLLKRLRGYKGNIGGEDE